MGKDRTENSFFKKSYSGKRAAVFVPHQDDECNVAAALIASLTSLGAEVFVIYLTNGDWKISAEIRLTEACSALEILGVPKDHVWTLGFGDAPNDPSHSNAFYAHGEPAVSRSGHTETYGAAGIPDLGYMMRGAHSLYTHEAMVRDIKDAILGISPELLVCVDMDEHVDHRALSLCFDEAMGQILRSEPDYKPEVFKGFGYPTAYRAPRDLYEGLNMLHTLEPAAGRTPTYRYDFFERAGSGWKERVRIPIPEGFRTRSASNMALRALKCHLSQAVTRSADRIINSDEVFRKRRSDGLCYAASVSASSGDASKLNDFMLENWLDIDSLDPVYGDYLWVPAADDLEKRAVFQWENPVVVTEAVLYGNITSEGRVLRAEIAFDDGYTLNIGPLPLGGKPLRVDIPERNVRSCSLRIIETEGEGAGISEFELYSGPERFNMPAPYLKITARDNFAYEYLIDGKTEDIDIGVYTYGMIRDITLNVLSGACGLKKTEADGNRYVLTVPKATRELVLEAAGNSDGEAVFDRVIIRRASGFGIIREKLICFKGKAFIFTERLKRKLKRR